MSHFNDPSSSFLVWVFLLVSDFLASSPNVRDIVISLDGVMANQVIIAKVFAQMSLRLLIGYRSRNDGRLQGRN